MTSSGPREVRVNWPPEDQGIDLDRTVRDLMFLAIGAADPAPFVAAAHAICAMKKSKPAVATAGFDDETSVRRAPDQEARQTYAP